MSDEDILSEIERVGERLKLAKHEVSKRIIGQDKVVDMTMNALLSGGHALLVGAPGLAKTRLVDTLGTVMGLNAKRIQFTPDLMPADILGSEVLEEAEGGKRSFRFIEGPIFCQLLMADEINRASPRTQAALLQAMQERHVTIAGHDHALPMPFHVLATQNPIEQEGTYPLPEAQLDRFLLQVNVEYPDEDVERRIMIETTDASEVEVQAKMTAETLMEAQALIRHVPVGDSVVDAILEIVRAGRPETCPDPELAPMIAWGPGPRASQALMLAVRARALLEKRLAPSVKDVLELAAPVLRHRMALTFTARAEGMTLDGLIKRLCATIG